MSGNEEQCAEDVMAEALAASLRSDERSWITQRNWDAAGGIAVRMHIRAILAELKANGYAVVPIPSVLHKGPHDTDSTMYAAAADRLDRNYGVGGSNLRRAISQLLKYVSAAAAERDSEGGE